MDHNDKLSFTPILPFDVTYGEQFAMYDHQAYIKNNEMCNQNTVKLESGNVTRFYRCSMQQPVKIGGD